MICFAVFHLVIDMGRALTIKLIINNYLRVKLAFLFTPRVSDTGSQKKFQYLTIPYYSWNRWLAGQEGRWYDLHIEIAF